MKEHFCPAEQSTITYQGKCNWCGEKEALAQTQEPVAWVSEDVCKGQYIDGRPRKIWWECEKGVGTAFYTAPPQRTWVGLTDEEIAQGCKESWVTEQAWQSAVWWAEAKLKEKNT